MNLKLIVCRPSNTRPERVAHAEGLSLGSSHLDGRPGAVPRSCRVGAGAVESSLLLLDLDGVVVESERRREDGTRVMSRIRTESRRSLGIQDCR